MREKETRLIIDKCHTEFMLSINSTGMEDAIIVESERRCGEKEAEVLRSEL